MGIYRLELNRAMAESMPAAAPAAKWDGYYATADLSSGNLPPWDSNRPCSQLLELLAADDSDAAANNSASGPCASQPDRRRRTFVDLGCGSGASVCHLATLGWEATGVDVCEKAVKMAQQRWKQQTDKSESKPGAEKASLVAQAPNFVCADFFEWSSAAHVDNSEGNDSPRSSVATTAETGGVSSRSTPGRPSSELFGTTSAACQARRQFDLVLDCQFFHALWTGDPVQTKRLSRAIAGCVAPGGKLLLLTGNLDDPKGDTGPTRLTAQQILEAFLGQSVSAFN